jgi:hypothetical protein
MLPHGAQHSGGKTHIEGRRKKEEGGRKKKKSLYFILPPSFFFFGEWCRCRDLNPGLRGYEPRALTN